MPSDFSAANLASAAQFFRTAAPRFFEQYSRERKRAIQAAPFIPNPAQWPDSGVHAAWLGHSTVLLKIDGFTILTDPVLGDRCGVTLGPMTVGLKRLVAPALTRKQLPPIDLLLLSHAHFDHFDIRTLRSLENRATTVVTAPKTSDLLRVQRYKAVQEIGWGMHTSIGPVTIHGLEVKHWGARVRTDTFRGYTGYLIEAAGRRIVFAGDTAETDTFRRIRGGGPVDLAIMPIGAYDPWIFAHCTPEQAWRMAQDCRAECVLPVHHQTFSLSREPYLEPIERLIEAAGPQHVATQRIGQQFHL